MNLVMKRCLFIVVSILLVAVSVSASVSGDTEVVVEGCGSTMNAALLDAKRAAVEQGVGTVLVSQTEIENFTLKKDLVLTKTSGAVRRYEKLGTRKEGDDQCVTIRAVVSLDDIRADLMALHILLESMQRPRMLVLMEGDNAKAAESEIVDYLTSKDFDVVSPAMVATLHRYKQEQIRKAIAGDPVVAARIGADNGAEYILIGQVKANPQKNNLLSGSGMYSAQAQISARVYDCSNSRIITAKNARSAMAHLSQEAALQGAVLKAAKRLMDRKLFETIVTSFQNQVNNGYTLDVTVRGLGSYSQQKQLLEMLRGLDGVRSANKRRFASGELQCDVVYQGNVDSFCEAVDGKKLADGKLAVTTVVGKRIVVEVK